MPKLLLVPSCTLLALCVLVITISQLIGRITPSQELTYLLNDAAGDRLYIQDIQHRLGYRLANAPVIDFNYAWSPDGTQVVFVSYIAESTEIFVAGVDGHSLRQLTVGVPQEYYPAWSPDGQHIVFSRQPLDIAQFSELVIMNVNNRQERVLTSSAEVEIFPAWSPDGTQIAYITTTLDGNNIIHIVDAQTGEVQVVMNELAGNFAYLSWSPDGTRILFSAYVNTAVIYVMDIITRRVTPLTDLNESNYLAAWSPDGTHIVFVSERDGTSDIYIMNSDGTNQQRLTYDPQMLHNYPTWSPDGSHITFTVSDFNDIDIYTMNADGSNPQRILSTAFEEWSPRWRP